MGVSVILAAAGRGFRMGGVDKALLPVGGRPLLVHCLETMEACSRINEIVVVAREDLHCVIRELTSSFTLPAKVVTGGDSRTESVRNGLRALAAGGTDLVAIHDVARPLVSVDLINRVIDAAQEHGAAVPALPLADTVKTVHPYGDDGTLGRVEGTVNRDFLQRVQTPQVFLHSLLVRAYRSLISVEEESAFTDDASIVEAVGHPVVTVPGDEENFKITTWQDYTMAQALVSPAPVHHRVGLGYDSHRLAVGRSLVLGGITIPNRSGLVGHSDGDVVLHAICDALLGACSLGDIGTHFRPGEQRWKDADSRMLLQRVRDMLTEIGCAVGNIDVTVVAEQPRLAPHIAQMRASVAAVIGIDEVNVSIKAKTNEKMDAVGRGEGIAALATCTVVGAFLPGKMRRLRDG